MALGGGVDVNVSHRFAIRPAQVDYPLNLRVSTGVVFGF